MQTDMQTECLIRSFYDSACTQNQLNVALVHMELYMIYIIQSIFTFSSVSVITWLQSDLYCWLGMKNDKNLCCVSGSQMVFLLSLKPLLQFCLDHVGPSNSSESAVLLFPKQGEDCRVLHPTVDDLYLFLNHTQVFCHLFPHLSDGIQYFVDSSSFYPAVHWLTPTFVLSNEFGRFVLLIIFFDEPDVFLSSCGSVFLFAFFTFSPRGEWGF